MIGHHIAGHADPALPGPLTQLVEGFFPAQFIGKSDNQTKNKLRLPLRDYRRAA